MVTKDLDAQEREKRTVDLEKWVNGSFVMPDVFEYLGDYESSDIEAGDTSIATRAAANYRKALFRDSQYARAGRKRLTELGIHNTFRELYQGARIAELSKRK